MEATVERIRSKTGPRSREALFGLGLLISAGLALRLYRIDFHPLWWDEGYSVWFATHPLGQMLGLTAEDIHPPLYYALLHGWTWVLGARPVALRLLSVVLATLTIPVLYAAGRQFTSQRVAWLAALLLVVNPFHVYYSQEVRMYAAITLLGAALLGAAWYGLRSLPTHPVRLVPYALLACAALYTQYYAVFLVAALALSGAWVLRRQARPLAAWVGAHVAVGLGFLPWVVFATPRLIPYVSQKVVHDSDRALSLPVYLARHLASFVAGHLDGPPAAYWPLALAPLLLIAAALWTLRSRLRLPAGASLPLAVVLLTLGLGFAVSNRYPFFPEHGERLLLLALPAFLLLTAIAIDNVWRLWPPVAAGVMVLLAVITLAGLASTFFVTRYGGDDYRPLISRTIEQGSDRDTVFCVYPWQVGYWRAYGITGGPNAVLSPDPGWSPSVAGALDKALAVGHVWFPAHLALGGILEGQVETYLAQRSAQFINQWYGPSTRLSGWSAVDPAEIHRIAELETLRFEVFAGQPHDLTLTSVAASQRPVPAANAVLPMVLEWESDAAPGRLSASIRLVDDLQRIWAQSDYEPVGQSASSGGDRWTARDRPGLMVPAGTPPGVYGVDLLLRDEDSSQYLGLSEGSGAGRKTSAKLFTIEVIPAAEQLTVHNVPVSIRRQIDLEDGISFIGASVGDTPAAPGERRKVNLFWRASDLPMADYSAFLQLLGRDGIPVTNWEAPPGGAYATSQWATGTLIRTQAEFRPPASLPDGTYRLIAGLFRQGDLLRLRAEDGTDQFLVTQVTVRGRERQFDRPAVENAANVEFGKVARLIGYDLASPAEAGGPSAGVDEAGTTFTITLYWQALETDDRAHNVFVHLLDEDGLPVGFGDGEPGYGRYPTTGWLAGEYLVDEHRLVAPLDLEPGRYRIAVGLYDPESEVRLVASNGTNQFVLNDGIEVSEPLR